MDKVYLFTDGACSGNPGPGGWGAILRYQNHHKELSGFEPETTNNRMELIAVIQALQALTKPCHIVVVTDSRYVQQGITQWLNNWIARDWKTASNTPVKNKDLWLMLAQARDRHLSIDWQWVKGHSGHDENERADQLAREAILHHKGLNT